jgi:hypothetical protein
LYEKLDKVNLFKNLFIISSEGLKDNVEIDVYEEELK